MIIGIGNYIGSQRRSTTIVSPDFITTWQTTTPSETITLPLTNNGTYDAVVDWGDNSTSNITAYNDADRTHTYTDAGTYTVSISGTLGGWSFNNGGDKLKIKSIENWGTNTWTYFDRAFYGCTNVVCNATDILDTSQLTSLFAAFYLASSFNGCLSQCDVSNVTNFGSMFREAAAFSDDLSAWDVSKATNMGAMLWGTSFDADISSWNVSGVTSFSGFLNGAALSTSNYDALLIAWSQLSLQPGQTVDFGSSKHSAGAAAAAKAVLTSAPISWVIIDGGQV